MHVYTALRALHATCAAVTIALFAFRAGCALCAVDWRVRWPALRTWIRDPAKLIREAAGTG